MSQVIDLQEKTSQLALYLTPGIGDVNFKLLISYCGSASKVFEASNGKLSKIPGIGKKAVQAIRDSDKFDEAHRQLERMSGSDTQVLMYNDPEYPQRLKEINDSPPILFYKGNSDLNTGRIVSIVGTRNATEYGKKIVSELVEALVPYAPLIVSGLAYGIDVQAHKESIKNSLDTVAVMASGIDIIYPAMHKKIASKITNRGGLLTEHPLGVKPDAPFFPARNRIIAGLSDVVIIVEAAARGGALITAELANGYNREVFAVPGDLHSKFSEGCNKLIRNQKANIFTSVDDLAYLLNWELEPTTKDAPKQDSHAKVSMSRSGRKVFDLLKQKVQGLTIDEISWQTEIPIAELSSELLTLEFNGLIVSLPGKKYRLSNS